jgi:hypothetical protein
MSSQSVRSFAGRQVIEIMGGWSMKALWARSSALLGALFLMGLCLAPAFCQFTFNEREVKSEASALDKAEVWSFDFRFKDPRLIKVNYPSRGARIFWYMWYQVINRTGKPEKFTPDFELVTLDNPGVYKDEILPAVVDAIKRIEDPTGYQDIKNSVTINSNSIPVSKPADQAFPRAITGVAVWDASPANLKKRDADGKDLMDSTRFSIFVRGLSNGYVTVDPIAPGLQPVTRYKTLQLNFRRQGDRFSTDNRDISFVAPAEWIYRAAGRKNP